MSYRNHLTPAQLRSFKRRARFTLCGEPCDVFSEPAPYDGGILFVTVNRNADSGDAWLESTSYTYDDPTAEIAPEYLAKCRKVDEKTARDVICTELVRWACMPEGTVTGWTREQIRQEANSI